MANKLVWQSAEAENIKHSPFKCKNSMNVCYYIAMEEIMDNGREGSVIPMCPKDLLVKSLRSTDTQ